MSATINALVTVPTTKPPALPVNPIWPNGSLVKTRLGDGFIVGHSKVGCKQNPNYGVLLITSDNKQPTRLWNAYNLEDWKSMELIDTFPVNCPSIPPNLKTWLIANRAGKVVTIADDVRVAA
jgi:hypothetical protein